MTDSTPKYELQIKLPHQSSVGTLYVEGEGYWTTVDGTRDLDYLRGQAEIMKKFWKDVRIIQLERVVIKETVVDW